MAPPRIHSSAAAGNRARVKRYRIRHPDKVTEQGRAYRKNHKAQLAANTKAWKQRHPERASILKRVQVLKHQYNLTLEEWNTMFEEQGFCCKICRSPISGRKNGQWCTDHNHETNQVRGILCTQCNSMLGMSKDDPSILRSGAKYLEEQEK